MPALDPSLLGFWTRWEMEAFEHLLLSGAALISVLFQQWGLGPQPNHSPCFSASQASFPFFLDKLERNPCVLWWSQPEAPTVCQALEGGWGCAVCMWCHWPFEGSLLGSFKHAAQKSPGTRLQAAVLLPGPPQQVAALVSGK